MQGPQDKARFRAAFERLELVWPLPRSVTAPRESDRDGKSSPDKRRAQLFLMHYQALEHLSIEAVLAGARVLLARSREGTFFPRPGDWRDASLPFELRLREGSIRSSLRESREQRARRLESMKRGRSHFLAACEKFGSNGAIAAALTPAPPERLEDLPARQHVCEACSDHGRVPSSDEPCECVEWNPVVQRRRLLLQHRSSAGVGPALDPSRLLTENVG